MINFFLATILLMSTQIFSMEKKIPTFAGAFSLENRPAENTSKIKKGSLSRSGSQSPRPCITTALINSLPETIEIHASASSDKLRRSFENEKNTIELLEKVEPNETKSFYSTNWPTGGRIRLVITLLASNQKSEFLMPQDGKTRTLEEHNGNFKLGELNNTEVQN